MSRIDKSRVEESKMKLEVDYTKNEYKVFHNERIIPTFEGKNATVVLIFKKRKLM